MSTSSTWIQIQMLQWPPDPFLLIQSELQSKYRNVKFNTTGSSLHGKALIEFLSDADKAILALEKVDKNLLQHLPSLKTISKFGVGLDTIDLHALSEFNVSLGWTPGVNKVQYQSS